MGIVQPPMLHLDVGWGEAFHHELPSAWREALSAWLARQRWFLAKGAPDNLRVIESFPVPVGHHLVWWLLVEAAGQQYQLPLVRLEEPLGLSSQAIARISGMTEGWLVDAWAWPDFGEEVLRRIRASPEESVPASPLQFWRDGEIAAVPDGTARALEHEQSNSALRFGERCFMKAFRSVASGVHPEEEMGRYLTGHSFRHAVPLRGGVRWTDGERATTLAVVFDFVPNQGSFWDWLQGQFDYPASEPALSAVWERGVLHRCRRLGVCTAELHVTLARPTDESAFHPEEFGSSDLAHLKERLSLRWQTLSDTLSAAGGSLASRNEFAEPMVRQQEEVLCWISAWQPVSSLGLRARIHGDYHLGQVLVDGDLLISDFEGEPLRPLAERRVKDSPLRDVAGMRRSFAYALGAAELRNGPAPWLRSFMGKMTREFTDTYFAAATQEPGLLPADEQDRRGLLQLYELEKLLYEVEYELRSRPDWLAIPLGALYGFVRGVVNSDARIGESNVS